MSGFTEFDNTPNFKTELEKKVKEKLIEQLSGPDFNDETKDEIKPKFLRAISKLFKDKIKPPPDFSKALSEEVRKSLTKQLAPSWMKNFMDILKLPDFTLPKYNFELIKTIFPEKVDEEKIQEIAKTTQWQNFVQMLRDNWNKQKLPDKLIDDRVIKNANKLIEDLSNLYPELKSNFDTLVDYIFPPSNDPPLIVALRKAVEKLIDQSKIKKDKPEIPKNLLPRFGFTIEDKSFAGQLKKLIQAKLYDQFMTDEFRIQQFNAKYEKYDACKIMKEYLNFTEAFLTTKKIAKKVKDTINPPKTKNTILENFQKIYQNYINASTYDTFYKCCVESNIDPNISDIYDKLSAIIELLLKTNPKKYGSLLSSMQQSKRILLLVISVANKDPKSIELLKKLYGYTNTPQPVVENQPLPKKKKFPKEDVFYGQMIHLEQDYPEYTEKSLQRYLSIIDEYNNKTDIRPLLNIKSADDAKKRFKQIQDKLDELNKTKEDDKENKKNAKADKMCVAYFAEKTQRKKNERIMYMSDLALLDYALKFDKSPAARELRKQIRGKISKTEQENKTDEAELGKMKTKETQMNSITSTILANLNSRLNPMGDITKKILANINERLGKPPIADTATKPETKTETKTTTTTKTETKVTPPGSASANAPPQDSVTPNYEAASGYNDDEGQEPDGVPVATSINPNTGKAYADYPETAYAGSYFAYEFHEDQKKDQYERGPWMFKEMFTTPPTINKEPEHLVRKLILTATDMKGSFKDGSAFEGKYNIELCDSETDKCEALMNSNAPVQDMLEKQYYTYFGKTKLIDGKKKTPEKTMEYDDGNTYVNRMKEAMFELIHRKVSEPETEENAGSKNGKGTDSSSVASIVEETVTNTIKTASQQASKTAEQALTVASAAAGAVVNATGVKTSTTENNTFTKELKKQITTTLSKKLKPGSGIPDSGSFAEQLEEEIKKALEKQFGVSGSPSSPGSFEEELKSQVQTQLQKQFGGPGSPSSSGSFEEELKKEVTKTLTEKLNKTP